MNVKSIRGYLDLFISGQNEAKNAIAKAFHMYHVKIQHPDASIPTDNVLITGPTGAGKDFMLDILMAKSGLPVVKDSMIGKTGEAYIGKNKLSNTYDKFSSQQKYGIVVLAEADKVLMNPEDPLNTELINVLENGEISGRRTDSFLHILQGAFQDIYDKEGPVTKDKLRNYGVREEILGRLPVEVNIPPPYVENLV